MSDDEKELTRRQAARKDLDEKNFWVIVRQLKDNNSTFRWKAAESLGRICDPRAVVPLIELMKDPVPEVQWVAAQSLGKCHDARAVEPLIGYLERFRPLGETRGRVGARRDRRSQGGHPADFPFERPEKIDT